jgi:hypothetical protein
MRIREFISLLIFVSVVVALYAAEARLLFYFIKDKIKKLPVRRFFSKRAMVIHFIALTGLICIAYGYFIEPYWIETKTVEIPTSKLKQTAIRLVQFSDLHCTGKIANEKKLVEIINGLKPDVIVFTGDSMNNKKALPLLKETLSSLKATLGKFAVRGNFDIEFWKNIDLFGGTGFVELDGNTVELDKYGEKFQITGVYCDKEDMIGDVLKTIPQDRFSIFLHHFPDLIEDLSGQNMDLYLAGHTHGGQIALPFYGAVITLSHFGKKYESGEYKVGSTILYVNRGIGLDGFPAPQVRFLARPEITVFDIKPPGWIKPASQDLRK